MKPLIVGEVNKLSVDPKFALYPYPANGSGGRLVYCALLRIYSVQGYDDDNEGGEYR
jgi:hypothetical protein